MDWIDVELYEPNIDDEAVLLMSDGRKQCAVYLGEGEWGTKRFADGTWAGVMADSGLVEMILPLPELPEEANNG